MNTLLAQVAFLPLCPPRGTGILQAVFYKQILFHPLVVHFPVALWLTSALFDLIFLKNGDRYYARTSMFLIGLGLLGAVVSINMGFCDAIPAIQEGVGQGFINRVEVHQRVALATTFLYAVSLLIRWRRIAIGRVGLIVLMAVGAAATAVTGYLGAAVRLVM